MYTQKPHISDSISKLKENGLCIKLLRTGNIFNLKPSYLEQCELLIIRKYNLIWGKGHTGKKVVLISPCYKTQNYRITLAEVRALFLDK